MNSNVRTTLLRLFAEGLVATFIAILVSRLFNSWIAGAVTAIVLTLLTVCFRNTWISLCHTLSRAMARVGGCFACIRKILPQRKQIDWQKVRENLLFAFASFLGTAAAAYSCWKIGTMLYRHFPLPDWSAPGYAVVSLLIVLFGWILIFALVEQAAKQTGDRHSLFTLSRIMHYRLGVGLPADSTSYNAEEKKEGETRKRSVKEEVALILAFAILGIVGPYVSFAVTFGLLALLILDALFTFIMLLATTKALSMCVGVLAGLSADWFWSPRSGSLWQDMHWMIGWSICGSLCGIAVWRLKIWIDNLRIYPYERLAA